MLYCVTVSARFEAAHNLIDHERGPEPLHGQSYNVKIVLEVEKLEQHDLAVDFVAAKKVLDAIAKGLDDKSIIENPALVGRNTSAENLARYFGERLAGSDALGSRRVSETLSGRVRRTGRLIGRGPENFPGQNHSDGRPLQ